MYVQGTLPHLLLVPSKSDISNLLQVTATHQTANEEPNRLSDFARQVALINEAMTDLRAEIMATTERDPILSAERLSDGSLLQAELE